MKKTNSHFLFKFLFSTLFAFLLPRTLAWAQGAEDNPDPLLTEPSLSLYEWNPGQSGELNIKLKLPQGYHAYEDMFRLTLLEPDGFKISDFKLKPVHEFYDKFTKKTRRGVEESSTLTAHLEAPLKFQKASTHLVVELTYQACSATFCLFPVTKRIQTPCKLIGAPDEPKLEAPSTPVTPAIPSKSFFSADYFSEMLNKGGLIIFLLAFLAGILTSFTPCIFPMIPITLAILGDHSESRSRRENFLISWIYVLGIATTYSSLGVVAASSGTLFGASLGNPYVLSFICIVFLAMALSMYGLYDLQMPAWVRQKFGGKVSTGNRHLTIYLTGLFAGIVASPCVGPVLVTILAYVATHQSKILGFFLLFTYALGLGLIFIILGLSNQFTRLLPRSGVWMNAIKFILGSLMLSAFYYYLSLLIPARAFDALLGLGLIAVASVFGAFSPAKNPSQGLHKGLMITLLLIGSGYLSLGVFNLRPLIEQRFISEAGVDKFQQLNWQPFKEELLQKAVQEKKPVIIDFWAEWCAACHELEQFTFSNAE
ncbi:MAG: protein-disulfide reductase DsbD family protein, partial [Pseudobdellovibrionaceae bacterium]